jgi:hypothetical protein
MIHTPLDILLDSYILECNLWKLPVKHFLHFPLFLTASHLPIAYEHPSQDELLIANYKNGSINGA